MGKRRLQPCCVLAALALCGACVKPPLQLDVGPLPETTLEQARSDAYVGRRVRWGGELVTTKPGKQETCFEIVQRPLDGEARPRETDDSLGRFVACANGFYDPAIYAPGREITVLGTVREPVTDTIGEYEYSYAKVAAEEIYLWPKRSRRSRVYYAHDPWPYYYGPYYYGPHYPYYPGPGHPWYPYWPPYRYW
jgi:outer membrane lipoprotein